MFAVNFKTHADVFRMIFNNFKEFDCLVNGERGIAIVTYGRVIKDKFVLVPHIQTVAQTLIGAINYMSKSLRSVPRWLKTTNFRCPLVQNVETGDRHLPYSFYEHGIIGREQVYRMETKCYESVRDIGEKVENVIKK